MNITPYVDAQAATCKDLSDNRIRYIAASILHGMVKDPLPATKEQAEDIIRWHSKRNLQ